MPLGCLKHATTPLYRERCVGDDWEQGGRCVGDAQYPRGLCPSFPDASECVDFGVPEDFLTRDVKALPAVNFTCIMAKDAKTWREKQVFAEKWYCPWQLRQGWEVPEGVPVRGGPGRNHRTTRPPAACLHGAGGTPWPSHQDEAAPTIPHLGSTRCHPAK
jgi:hypothetical protein